MTAKIIEKAMAPFEKEIRACEFNIEQQNNSLARARNEEQKMYITEIIDMKEKEKEMWQMSYDHVQRIADVLTKEKFEAEVDMLYKIAANGNLEKRIENVKAICVNDTVQENVAKGIDIAISGPTFYNDEHGYMVSFGGDTYQYKDKIKSQKYKWGGGFWYKLFDSIELAEEEVSKMQEVFGGLRFEMKVNQKDIEAYERILAEEMEKKEAEKN